MSNIPYDPIIHDLSETPRERSANEIVEYWLDTFQTKNVLMWTDALHSTDIPTISFTFSGIFGHILLLEYGYNTTVSIAEPIMGTTRDKKQYFFTL